MAVGDTAGFGIFHGQNGSVRRTVFQRPQHAFKCRKKNEANVSENTFRRQMGKRPRASLTRHPFHETLCFPYEIRHFYRKIDIFDKKLVLTDYMIYSFYSDKKELSLSIMKIGTDTMSFEENATNRTVKSRIRTKKGRPYAFIHNKRPPHSKDEDFRSSMVKQLSETPKSNRLDPEKIPDTVYDIPCVMTEFKVPPLEERKERRRDFELNVRSAFLKYLAKTKFKELRAAGITLKQIQGMKRGYTPNGFNTHHMVPLHGGGTNDFSNLVLIRRVPYHDNLHNKVINPQIRGIKEGESVMIKIPRTDAGVFVPHERFLPHQKEALKQAAEKRKQKLKPKQEKEKKNKRKLTNLAAAARNAKGR